MTDHTPPSNFKHGPHIPFLLDPDNIPPCWQCGSPMVKVGDLTWMCSVAQAENNAIRQALRPAFEKLLSTDAPDHQPCPKDPTCPGHGRAHEIAGDWPDHHAKRKAAIESLMLKDARPDEPRTPSIRQQSRTRGNDLPSGDAMVVTHRKQDT